MAVERKVPFMFKTIRFLVSALLLLSAFVGVAVASGEGQEDLDKATDTKLNASTISDLSEVVRLTESALKKGLDEANTDFANKLLASTLLQRGQETVKQILTIVSSPADFREKRRFALSDLEKAVKLDPKQSEAYVLIAQLHLLPGGEVKTARESLDKALTLGIEEPQARAKALILRSGLQEQPEKKVADLDEAVRLVPGNADAIRARGLLLADLNKLELALADLNKAIELDPEDGPSYEAKAIVSARLKKYDDALVALDKAGQLSPDSVMPLLQRARVHSFQMKLDSALEDLNKALAKDSDNVAVLLMRASVYQEKGNRTKALADVDRALKLRPELPVAIRTRALLLADGQMYDDAVVELEKLRKLDPKDTLALLQLAMLYSAQKKSAKAIETYTELLALDSKEWRALRGRGDVYLNMGRQTEALADYEKALLIEPGEHGILNNLAWVLATSPDDKLRNGRRAVELATKACEVSEYKLAYILSTLAAAYAETGDFEAALKWSSKAVEMGDKEHDDALKKELESYKAKKPWRELLSEEKPVEKKSTGKKSGEKKPAEKKQIEK